MAAFCDRFPNPSEPAQFHKIVHFMPDHPRFSNHQGVSSRPTGSFCGQQPAC